jgi:hypothetical protein
MLENSHTENGVETTAIIKLIRMPVKKPEPVIIISVFAGSDTPFIYICTGDHCNGHILAQGCSFFPGGTAKREYMWLRNGSQIMSACCKNQRISVGFGE